MSTSLQVLGVLQQAGGLLSGVDPNPPASSGLRFMTGRPAPGRTFCQTCAEATPRPDTAIAGANPHGRSDRQTPAVVPR
jgi:hypothetical protein